MFNCPLDSKSRLRLQLYRPILSRELNSFTPEAVLNGRIRSTTLSCAARRTVLITVYPYTYAEALLLSNCHPDTQQARHLTEIHECSL
jgi:hypothetical protein